MPKDWDVIVVGGGPAGMMAALTAAAGGHRVLLVEKNNTLGKKLLITGGGRCNVTNSEFDNRKLLTKFKNNSQFLFSAFTQYSVKDALDFFHQNNMPTKVENELRTFPVSNSAQSVWDVLVNNLKKYNVEVLPNSPVADILEKDGKVIGVRLVSKEIILGQSIIIATGGTSRPETGSTGDAYKWLKKLGHTIIEPTPSLVPIAIKEPWIKNLAGVSLPNTKITVWQNKQKQLQVKGKVLFTHVGLSGPTILNLSKDIGELLKYGEVIITLDLTPTHDNATLNSALQTLFKTHDKKTIANALPDLIPKALVPIILELAQIKKETKCNSVTREERIRLINLLKALPLTVKKLLGVEKAIITSGGVALEEVDFKTMRSRLFPNLYLIGDILNIDRPSGGYSLQLCWTTGFVAGSWVNKD